MSKKFISAVDMYKTKHKRGRRKSSSAGCMTMIVGVLLFLTAIITLIF